jgi:glycerophosphoryl diester phosphodiesterase
VLRRTGAAERVCVAGAWDGWIEAVRAEVPGVSTALGWRAQTALIAAGRTGVRPPRLIATGPYAHVAIRLGRVPIFAERLVSMAGDLGVKVIVWTVNDQPGMERLLDVGVRGLITDHPEVLRGTLEMRGEWAARQLR